MNMMLTTTRSKRAQHVVHPLVMVDQNAVDMYFTLDEAGRQGMWDKIDPATQAAIIEKSNNAA